MSDLDIAQVEAEVERRLQHGLCLECGSPGAKEASFMRVMSFLVFTRFRRWSALLCPPCIARHGTRELAISCTLGWWGIPWGLMTFGAIFINGRSLLRSTAFGRFAALLLVGLVGFGVFSIGQRAGRSAGERREAEGRGDLVSVGVEREFRQAERLLEAGRTEDAIRHLEIAERGAPRSATIQQLLGFAHLQLGAAGKSRAHLERALRNGAADDYTLEMLASACQFSNDLPAARRYLRTLIDRGTSEVEIHERYQGLCRSTGDLDDARALYRQRLAQSPTSAEARYLDGLLIDDSAARAAAMRQAIGFDGGMRAARVELVRALLELRDFDAAEAACQQLDAAGPVEQPGPILPAEVAVARGDLSLALARVEAALAGAADDIVVRMQRACILGWQERFDDACREYERLIAAPEIPPVWVFQARAQLVDCLLQRGDTEQALARCRELRSDVPNAAPWQVLTVRALAGRALWYRGELDAALRELESCPDGAFGGGITLDEAILARSLILLQRGDRDAAMELLRSLAARGDDQFVEERLAARFLLGGLGPDEYLAAARRSSVFYDNDAWFHIGVRHQLDGDPEAARAAYQRSLEVTIGRNHPAAIVRDRLAELGERK
ncbi:MAG: tetratricopeptide repeat protein [Planctomycetes bacterium]|nr:tetratricopeptide repeat protein [Planctomycetota bacterium]